MTHVQAHRYLGITYNALKYAVAQGWIKPKRVAGNPHYSVEELDRLALTRKYDKRKKK
jgi:hypothetical protein